MSRASKPGAQELKDTRMQDNQAYDKKRQVLVAWEALMVLENGLTQQPECCDFIPVSKKWGGVEASVVTVKRMCNKRVPLGV